MSDSKSSFSRFRCRQCDEGGLPLPAARQYAHLAMNRHRMLPLFFTLSFVLLLPMLALSPARATTPPVRTKFATILAKADHEASATRAYWRDRTAPYVELVSFDQR